MSAGTKGELFSGKPRIVLFGEYSGVHTNLAAELSPHCDIVTVSSGDQFKGFPRTVNIAPSGRFRAVRLVTRVWREAMAVARVPRATVIQFINPFVISSAFPGRWVHGILCHRAVRSYLLAAGDDPRYWQAFREGRFRISPHRGTLELDLKRPASPFESVRRRQVGEYVGRRVDAIVPMAVEYEIAYERFPKVLPRINFPIRSSAFTSDTNTCSGALRIYHGVQSKRRGFKGSDFIDLGIAQFSQSRPGQVVVRRTEDVSYSTYLEHVRWANVVMDQTNSFGPGMAALNAMAAGKAVLTGCKPEYLAKMGIASAPFWNIDPDPASVKRSLMDVWEARARLPQICNDARAFVRQHHDAAKIAQQFLNVWDIKPARCR